MSGIIIVVWVQLLSSAQYAYLYIFEKWSSAQWLHKGLSSCLIILLYCVQMCERNKSGQYTCSCYCSFFIFFFLKNIFIRRVLFSNNPYFYFIFYYNLDYIYICILFYSTYGGHKPNKFQKNKCKTMYRSIFNLNWVACMYEYNNTLALIRYNWYNIIEVPTTNL